MVNKGGRPHLDSQHAAHKISLQGKHLAMLDEAIMATQDASADFIAAVARAKARHWKPGQARWWRGDGDSFLAT